MTARTIGIASILAATFLLDGCSLVGETYSEGTLEQVLNGAVRNDQNRYRIDPPRIAAVRKNTGIIREGSLFLVIVGPDLKKHVTAPKAQRKQWGVHLKKQPRTHLVLERIFDDDVEIDLFEGGKTLRAEFPQFVGSSEIDFGKFRTDVALDDLEPGNEAALADVADSKLMLTRVDFEKRALPQPVADVALATDPRLRVDRPTYILTSEGCDWVVVQGDLLTWLMLDFLRSDKRQFKGGVAVQSVFHRDTRRDTGFGGTVRIRWIDLGGTLFFQAK
jgi:hypothetical protein